MNVQPELSEIATLAADELGLEKLVEFCGKGAFKETYRARDKHGTTIALKLVDRTKIDLVRTEREIEALARCNSPRVAKLIGTHTFKSPDNRVFDVVLEEYFDGESLDDHLRASKFTSEQVLELGSGLMEAVQDLHPLRLVHRDIKPANIMFRHGSPDPVLVDFGLVRDLSQSSLTATWLPSGPGTPFFASPEQLNNDKAMIDWRSDQFSIGVIIGLLLTDVHPYQTDPANLNTAVYAVQMRRGPSAEFRRAMEQRGAMAVVRMVSPWPVQRFTEPGDALKALRTLQKL